MEKIKLLLYCTKSNKQLFYDTISQKYMYGLNRKNDKFNALNGHIGAECDFEVEEILSWMNEKLRERIYKESCLNDEQLSNYMARHDTMYAVHIKNLNIFDKPREISEYHISYFNKELGMMREKHVEKAPQNMCRVFDTKGNYILISIRPERLCKILNGEKTIEICKKVLKEMINNA